MAYLYLFILIYSCTYFSIFLHEVAHLCMGRLLKLHVKEFCIGTGWTLFDLQLKNTRYHFKIIPLSGFCVFIHSSSYSIISLKHLIVTSAGVIMNFFIAIAATMSCFSVNFSQSLIIVLKLFLNSIYSVNISIQPPIIKVFYQLSWTNKMSFILLGINVLLFIINTLPYHETDGAIILKTCIKLYKQTNRNVTLCRRIFTFFNVWLISFILIWLMPLHQTTFKNFIGSLIILSGSYLYLNIRSNI